MHTKSHRSVKGRQPATSDTRAHGPMRRTTDDRVWVGVAGGVAERLRVDAVVVRTGFVVASAIWGVGIVVYLVLWAVLPELDVPTRNVVKPGLRPTRFRGGALVAIVAGAMYLLRWAGLLPPDRLLLPWLLIVLGVVVLWGREPLRPLPRPALMPGPPNSLLTDVDFEDPPAEPEAPPTVGEPDPVEAVDAAHGANEEKPRRKGSTPALVPVGTLTAGALLVVSGLLYLLDDAGMMDVSWRLFGGVALTVIGVALVAGGWWGRPRGLILLASGLCLFLLVATVLQVPFSGGIGRRDIRPIDVAEVFEDYQLAVGTIVLDLRDIELDVRRDVSVSVAAGELRVMVPLGVEVDINARVGFGEVVVFDQAGTGVAVVRSFVSDGVGSGTWILDLDVGIGKLSVEQVP